MKKYFLIVLSLLLLQNLNAQNTEAEVTKLLITFLDSVDHAAMHDRFWAEDLTYTSSAGLRFGKTKIMSGFESDKSTETNGEKSTYSASEIQVKDLKNGVAILNFKMEGTQHKPDGTKISTVYLNSGTLEKRNDKWKVVNWHATKAAVEE